MYLANSVRGWPNGARAATWAGVIAVSGIVLPYVACLVGYGLALIGGADFETTYRLRGLLFPAASQWTHVIDQMLIQLPPFLVQAAVAGRMLGKTAPGPTAQRLEYRIGGCFIGLSIATVLSFMVVAMTQRGWVRPGLDIPVILILTYYLGGAALGLAGGWYGRRLARRRVKGGRRTRNPVLRRL